jgi:hypothetical protein
MRSRIFLLAALTIALAASSAKAQQLQQIKITVPTVSTIFYPLYYGQDTKASSPRKAWRSRSSPPTATGLTSTR